MTFEDVKRNWNNGTYKLPTPVPIRAKILAPDTVLDEDKSVKWNREEIAKLNDIAREQHEQLIKEQYKLRDKFEEDLYQAAYGEYKLNRAQYKALYEYVMYEASEHDYQCVEFVNDFEEFLDFFFTTVNLRDDS